MVLRHLATVSNLLTLSQKKLNAQNLHAYDHLGTAILVQDYNFGFLFHGTAERQ